MKKIIIIVLSVCFTAGSLIPDRTWGYTKTNTVRQDGRIIVFDEQYQKWPHSWAVKKAIDLLRTDGFVEQANVAEKYLLPIMLGTVFNDVWGDADLAGASVLDYYKPDPSDHYNGYGDPFWNIYQNSTGDYKFHPFYGYGNAAEHAQFRYEAAKRAYLGKWDTDANYLQDHMAGWVVDRVSGQEDPIQGKWACGSAGSTCPSGSAGIDNPNTRFGDGQTPQSAITDLLQNHSMYKVVFPQYDTDTEKWLSRIYVPNLEVFDHHGGVEWLDDHFENADDVVAYMGSDGHGSAIYANWTFDALGPPDDDYSSPLLFYVPENSKEHAFFLLGWAIHLAQDCTVPMHTTDDDYDKFNFDKHNNIESLADDLLWQDLMWDGKVIKNYLPALTSSKFTSLYPFPPPPPPSLDPPLPNCVSLATDPAFYYKQRWYSNTLTPKTGEGVAHAYTREAAEISQHVMPYLECIETVRDRNWNTMGFFTALELDLEVKAAAGLINRYLNEVGIVEGEVYDGNGGPYCSQGTSYHINGTVTVPAGKTLTLCPGITLEFAPGAKIKANGTLVANGSSGTGTIRFVSKADNTKGMKISYEFTLKNGGEVKLY